MDAIFTKTGPRVKVDGKPVRERTSLPKENVLIYKMLPIFDSPGTYYLWLWQTPEIRNERAKGGVPLFPFRRMIFGPGPLEMIWKQKDAKGLVGVIRFIAEEKGDFDMKVREGGKIRVEKGRDARTDAVFIDMMTVRKGWRRNKINTLMIEHIAKNFPGRKLVVQEVTDDGRKFFTRFQPDVLDTLPKKVKVE